MTKIDTRKYYKTLVAADFSEKQAEAILYGVINNPLNTLAYYKKLIEVDFSEKQAEAIAELSFKSCFNLF